jgi:hypothetical protein
VEELVKVLYVSAGETSFAFEDYYCLHPRQGGGYVHFVPDGDLIETGYPILCEVYSSVEIYGAYGFSDIAGENGNPFLSIILAKAMGIISGYDDGTFRPDRIITYNEAITMLIRTFGLGGSADADGGYPKGYIEAADKAGMTANIDFDGNGSVSAKNFNTMLTSALGVDVSKKIQFFRSSFVPPKTAGECVQMYAEAVMERNGVLQYALYGHELKYTAYNGLVSFDWLTGASSPWVAGFDIIQISDLEFQVVFHYATSTGASDDAAVNVLLENITGSYRIAGLD